MVHQNFSLFIYLMLLFLTLDLQISGQRALALNLVAAVLDKALHNICRNQGLCAFRNDQKVDRSIDWEAVWAYALGPEPELILSLR